MITAPRHRGVSIRRAFKRAKEEIRYNIIDQLIPTMRNIHGSEKNFVKIYKCISKFFTPFSILITIFVVVSSRVIV